MPNSFKFKRNSTLKIFIILAFSRGTDNKLPLMKYYENSVAIRNKIKMS